MAENSQAHLFLIGYAQWKRVKIWGHARVIEGDPDLLAKLTPPNYRVRTEQAILIHVDAWDLNCPRHMPLRFEAGDVAAALQERDKRIAALENELVELRQGGPHST